MPVIPEDRHRGKNVEMQYKGPGGGPRRRISTIPTSGGAKSRPVPGSRPGVVGGLQRLALLEAFL